jgi:hypothetical protein
MGTFRLHTRLGMTLVGVLAMATAAASPAFAANTVSGSAFGESVNVTVAGINVSSGPLPTVALPATGGSQTNSLASICVTGVTPCDVLSAGILNVSTSGNTAGPSSTSSASVATVNAFNSLVTADAISSTCTANANGVSGSSSLVNAKVGGISVSANPAPNTTLLNVNGIAKVVLNEQTSSTGSGANSITVNAVHIYLNAGPVASGDIIISQSHCDVAGGNVVPVGTIGVLGLTGLAGIGFALVQHRSWQRRMAAAAKAQSLA